MQPVKRFKTTHETGWLIAEVKLRVLVQCVRCVDVSGTKKNNWTTFWLETRSHSYTHTHTHTHTHTRSRAHIQTASLNWYTTEDEAGSENGCINIWWFSFLTNCSQPHLRHLGLINLIATAYKSLQQAVIVGGFLKAVIVGGFFLAGQGLGTNVNVREYKKTKLPFFQIIYHGFSSSRLWPAKQFRRFSKVSASISLRSRSRSRTTAA